MHEKVEINTEYITLGQLIKKLNILDSGGMVKAFIQEQGANVNGVKEFRRGRKIYPQDKVEIEGFGTYIVIKEE